MVPISSGKILVFSGSPVKRFRVSWIAEKKNMLHMIPLMTARHHCYIPFLLPTRKAGFFEHVSSDPCLCQEAQADARGLRPYSAYFHLWAVLRSPLCNPHQVHAMLSGRCPLYQFCQPLHPKPYSTVNPINPKPYKS